jgi:hypothetical protein
VTVDLARVDEPSARGPAPRGLAADGAEEARGDAGGYGSGLKTSTMSEAESIADRPPPITYHLPSTTAAARPWRFVGRSGAFAHVPVAMS